MIDIVEHVTLAMLNISMYYTIFLFNHVNLQHTSCKRDFPFRWGNSVGPDQIASSETS